MTTIYIYLAVLYGVFILSLKFCRSLTGGFLFLFLLIIATTFVETLGFLSMVCEDIEWPWVFSIYEPIEYFLLAKYFEIIIIDKRIKKSIHKSLIVVIPVNILLSVLSYQFGLNKYYSFLLIILCVTTLSLIYFYQLLTYDIDKTLTRNPNFFIVLGILLFYSCSFLLMGLIYFIYQENLKLARQIFSINHILNIFYYSLIGYAFYIQWKSTKSSSSSLEGH